MRCNMNGEKEKTDEISIIINGKEKLVLEKKLSFIDVVILAFGIMSTEVNTIYTMTFKRGEEKKREGSLVEGDTIRVKAGMIFNVTATDKS